MMKENEIAKLHGNEITLNADRMNDMSDQEIIKIVRHELNHYLIDRCAAFERESRARARELVLSGQLTPVDETGENTSEELYDKLLEEDRLLKNNPNNPE